MPDSQKGHRTEIIVALIGLAGALGTALIANWDKVVPPKPPRATLKASTPSIAQGESVSLSWSASHADNVTLQPLGIVEMEGSREVSPKTTTTYRLVATSSDGRNAESTVTVKVAPDTTRARRPGLYPLKEIATGVPLLPSMFRAVEPEEDAPDPNRPVRFEQIEGGCSNDVLSPDEPLKWSDVAITC